MMKERIDSMPMISPSSDAEWKRYYEKKYQEADKQLKDLASAMAHMLRLSLEGKKEDCHMLARLVTHRLQYPRDKNQIIEELAKWTDYNSSILRKTEGCRNGLPK